MAALVDLDLWSWISPFDTYRSAADVVDAVGRVHLTGFRTGVLLPTLYDDWTQAQVQHSLGPELTVSSAGHAGQIRAAIEALGVPCGGWSVPRGTGDVAAEGYTHGLMAAHFDYFVLNFEDGWSGFWTADGRAVVDLWLGAFWSGVADGGGTNRLNGHVGVTMVTNTGMMSAVSDAEAAAWVGGTNFDCLEAYVPGDPGLDPGNAVRIWRARLDRIGIADRPIVPILEQGDLPSLVAQYAHPVRGAQIWTLSIAAATEWPAVEPAPAPEPEPEPVPVDAAWQAKKGLVVQLAGSLLDVADQLDTAANRTPNVLRAVIHARAADVRARAQQILA